MTSRVVCGLGGKLSVFAALLIVATTVAFAAVLGFSQFRVLRAQHESLGLGIARASAGQAEIGTFSGDVGELDAVLSTTGSFPGVIAVAIYDAGGRLLARRASASDEDPTLEQLRAAAFAGPAALDPPPALLRLPRRRRCTTPRRCCCARGRRRPARCSTRARRRSAGPSSR
ncbi:MAG: hypothetical protein MZW92_19345 [Comamonadaceae bacterium]|nr:hypothetical protein [Comamonadaceae bacterium]